MPAARRRRSASRYLTDMEAVIDALDGDAGVKKLTGAKQNNLWNWRNQQGKFPARTCVVMTRALADRGYTAPLSLWGVSE